MDKIFIPPAVLAGIGLLFLLSGQQSVAGDLNDLPVISIIIDDIGYRNKADREALALPGPIAYAIMPHSPNAVAMANIANERDKDVLLHLPMEAVRDEKNRLLGPGALMLDMSREDFINILDGNLRSFPNIIGVNNHMGSLLTRHAGRMAWLMDFLRSRNIFYIDSVTSRLSVATRIAREKQVPYLKRDVFLDNQQDPEYINRQFNELIGVARRKGAAIAIGHPHAGTISVLAEKLPSLDSYGVRLISLKKMMMENHRPQLHNVSALSLKPVFSP